LRALEERLYQDAAAAGPVSALERGKPLRLVDAVVRPEWIDYNRHMSDFRYGQVFGDAMDSLYRRVGVDEAYRATGRMYYSVETHLMYLGEAKAGEALYVTTQLLAVDEKRLHVFHRLFRGRDDALIATDEQMHLHVDTAQAKATAVDPAVRAKLEAIRNDQAGLPRPHEAGRSTGQRH
jgi:carnitine 3-dehydrogenase